LHKFVLYIGTLNWLSDKYFNLLESTGYAMHQQI